MKFLINFNRPTGLNRLTERLCLLTFSFLFITTLACAVQGECLGKMKYQYLDSGIKLYSTFAMWDKPKGFGKYEEIGTTHSISFPASISGHKFAWASIFFGKKRGKPIFETTLNVDGDDVLTGSFTTSMEDEPFYIRVLYMHECSQIILEQKFQP